MGKPDDSVDPLSLSILAGFILVLLGKHLVQFNPSFQLTVDKLEVSTQLPSVNLGNVVEQVKDVF